MSVISTASLRFSTIEFNSESEFKRDNSRWNYKFGNNDVTIIIMRNYNKNYIDSILVY
jgi:hypothetical protein